MYAEISNVQESVSHAVNTDAVPYVRITVHSSVQNQIDLHMFVTGVQKELIA